ncbi:MAG: pantoate--beta-alanine ligase [Bacteroidota bacterium]
MFVFRKVVDLQQFLQSQRKLNRQIGFVPTMGALHNGHLSLIEQSRKTADLTVCSIFVNPTQFNDPADLKKYPRPIEADIRLLTNAHCDVLFLPYNREVYPKGKLTKVNMKFGKLNKVMEGQFRPGHFEGVVQVVNRLLEIVEPDYLLMGQKDFQQFSIIASMLEQLNSKVRLRMCPIVREEDGLAMSSRNRRLTKEQRQKSVLISRTLKKARKLLKTATVAEVKSFALEALAEPEEFKPEYFEIVDGRSLQPLEKINPGKLVVACAAVWVGEIRLIDNMICQNEQILYPE